MKSQWTSLTIFALVFALILSNTVDLDGQILRRWRSAPVQQSEVQVCGPDGCVAYPSQTFYQPRLIRPDVVATVVSQPVAPSPTITRTSAQSPAEAFVMSAEEASSGFHKSVLKSAVEAQRKGQINRLQLIRIRVAMLSPAFRENVQLLAVTQIAASGDDGGEFLKYDSQGNVAVELIDWEGLIAFLERLLPLILQLISIFGGI